MPMSTRRSNRTRTHPLESEKRQSVELAQNEKNKRSKRAKKKKESMPTEEVETSEQTSDSQISTGGSQTVSEKPQEVPTENPELNHQVELKQSDSSSRTGNKQENEDETGVKTVSEPVIDANEVARNVMEAYKQESLVRKHIKGKPKSGRMWKTEQTARFSNMKKDKPLKSSWQLKMAQKAEKLSVRKFQQELEDAKRQAIELKKQRRAEHQKTKEENRKKSEVVQVIKNTAKLKRMKKKQLRFIEKR